MSTAEDSTRVHSDADLSLLRMLDSEVLANPYVSYRVLRDHEPVHWDPYMHAWVVTSYPEVLTVLLQYSADRTPQPAHLDALGLSFMTPFSEMMLKQMMFMDGAAHSRLRSICAAAFTPRRVEELRTVIEAVAESLIDTFLPAGEADLVAEFANPLPALVTARLLGVPEKDHQQLHAWVLDLAEILGNFQHHPDRVVEIVQSMEALKQYIAAQMEEQRDNPAGLIGSLMLAEANGSRLTDEEVIANTIITLIGGHETTTNLITNGFLTLLREPGALEQLRTHPEIINSAVEELLRFESPVQHTARIAPADMELGGKSIKKGSRVVAVLAAANRDPDRFPDPDRLDLLRTDNRHLAFGWAAHFCFGAPLARMEAQIGFNLLLKRLSKPVLLDNDLRWRENAGLRGLYGLKIGFTRGSSTYRGQAHKG